MNIGRKAAVDQQHEAGPRQYTDIGEADQETNDY